MNIINIIIKEIKLNLRDKRTMLLMILFPICLIAVLGTALNGFFSSSSEAIKKVDVLYTNEGTGRVSEDFQNNFIKQGNKFYMNFKEEKDIKKAEDYISNAHKYGYYVRLTSDNVLEFYKDEIDKDEASILDSIISTYVSKYNLVYKVYSYAPQSVNKVLNTSDSSFTRIVSVNKKRAPKAMDYYAITMTTLIITYGALGAISSVVGEKKYNTKNRIFAAPVRKLELLFGKTIGNCAAILVQVIIVIIVSKFGFNAYFGDNIPLIMVVLLSQIVMVVSIGISIGSIFKNQSTGGALFNVVNQLFLFLGGCYFPLDQFKSNTLDMFSYISPLKWTNNSIFDLIYTGSTSKIPIAIGINLLVAFMLLLITSIKERKELA